jgi:tetratricopeptide (TPR) repeat protein
MSIALGRKIKTGLAVGLLCLLVLLVFLSMWQDDTADRLVLAKKLLQQGHPEQALEQLHPLLQRDPADGSVCYLAAEAYSRKKDYTSAFVEYGRVPADHERRAAACFRAGDILLLQLFQPTKAEDFLREAVALDDDLHAAEAQLAALYGLCGLTSLTSELRFKRVRAGKATEVDLVLLGLGDTAAENNSALASYQKSAPDDALTQLAAAHQAWQQHDFLTARLQYEKGLTQRPDLCDAQVRLGRILKETGDDTGFLNWHAGLSKACDEHADLWAVRGDYSLSHQDVRGAIRCYWEAARREPAHRSAHHQLGQALASLGETQIAEAFQRRNEHLQQLLLAAKQFNVEASPEKVIRVALAAQECGHVWEAWTWAEMLRKRFPQGAEALKHIGRPSSDSPRVQKTAQPALTHDLSSYAMPDWMNPNLLTQPTVVPQQMSTTTGSLIRFVEESAAAGLRFEFQHGDKMAGPGMRMFQFSGGGVGAVDYDRDGWPDVFLTQGGDWPEDEPQPPSDRVFRNQRGTGFQDTTVAAGVEETSYSQGLAVGDFDADGWPDVFVANVNENRLFRSNGDGTFSDVTQSAGIVGDAWSTSVACADLNGDSLPDFYVVNYLTGPNLLSRICYQADGTPRACTPHEFDAAEDQLLLNLGNGQFQDVTAEAGVIASGGKGLGVIAADFEGSGRLSLFVGNDTTANFFFQNQTVTPGGVPQFVEAGVVTGLAFDREGRTQACMGIAAGDADGDQQLDLFVTNYYNESNTLYQRQPTLMFFDVTLEARLKEPSIRQLGFGAQFLDADLDGWSDLIVTNGHVDDETARDIPLHMPTQFFRNAGSGRFDEISPTQLGPWFEGNYLGRAVARIDWNRDGEEDFIVGNLDSPTALLTNRTSAAGKFIALQLVGISSAREAIGTTVEVKTNDRTLSKQLVAGDGYQASNERKMIFGVGDADVVDITIRWPSGHSNVYKSIPTAAFWIAIEGRRDLLSTNR